MIMVKSMTIIISVLYGFNNDIAWTMNFHFHLQPAISTPISGHNSWPQMEIFHLIKKFLSNKRLFSSNHIFNKAQNLWFKSVSKNSDQAFRHVSQWKSLSGNWCASSDFSWHHFIQFAHCLPCCLSNNSSLRLH